MQTALTFVAILSIVMLFLCGTRPAFVLAVISAVCCIVVSYILRKRTDEKDAKDAALQNKITNWRKVRRRQLISDDNSDGMFDTGGIIQDLRLSQEEDEQFCEEKHEISYFKKYYDFLNTLSFEFLYTQNTFITSNIPITIYPVDKTEKCEIWLPLSSHVGVLFSENKKYKRNHLINRTGKTESLNCLVANNANLYYQKTALLIGSNKNCLTKAYDIVSDPHFKLSNL